MASNIQPIIQVITTGPNAGKKSVDHLEAQLQTAKDEITQVQEALLTKAVIADITSAINTLKGGVAVDGDTLNKLNVKIGAIQTLLNSDNVALDTVQEIVDAIETVQTSLATILVNDLTTGGATKALTAQQGVVLKGLVDALTISVNSKLSSSATTDAVTEGATNQYFTAQRVRNVVLTGITFLTNTAVTASDSILVAKGKLQAQITALIADVATKAGLTSINTFTQINQAPANVLTTGATLTPDASKVFQTFTTSANFAIVAPINRPSAGNNRIYKIKIIYAGAHSVTSMTGYKYNGTAPAFSNAIGKYDLLICDDDGVHISYELKAGYTS